MGRLAGPGRAAAYQLHRPGHRGGRCPPAAAAGARYRAGPGPPGRADTHRRWRPRPGRLWRRAGPPDQPRPPRARSGGAGAARGRAGRWAADPRHLPRDAADQRGPWRDPVPGSRGRGRAPAHTRHVRIAPGAPRCRKPAHLHPAAGWRPRRAHAERADRPSPGHRPARRRARPRRLGAGRPHRGGRTAARAGPAPFHAGGAVASRGGSGPAAGIRAGRGGGGRRAGVRGPGREGQPGGGSPLIPAAEHLHSRA